MPDVSKPTGSPSTTVPRAGTTVPSGGTGVRQVNTGGALPTPENRPLSYTPLAQLPEDVGKVLSSLRTTLNTLPVEKRKTAISELLAFLRHWGLLDQDMLGSLGLGGAAPTAATQPSGEEATAPSDETTPTAPAQGEATTQPEPQPQTPAVGSPTYMKDDEVQLHLNIHALSAPRPEQRRQLAMEELNWLLQQGKISQEQYDKFSRRISVLYPEEAKKEEDLMKNPLFLMLLLSSFLSGFNSQRPNW